VSITISGVSWGVSKREKCRWATRFTVLPSGRTSRVREILTYDGSLQTAYAPQSINIRLADEIDISRGDMFVKADVSADGCKGVRGDAVLVV